MPGQLIPALPAIGAGGRIVAAPFQFVTSGDDHLRLTSYNSASGVTLGLQGRRYDESGEILPIDLRHTPNTDRTAATQDYPFGKGAILNLQLRIQSGSAKPGQTYCLLQLLRGSGPAAIVIGTILAGYVATTLPLAYPGSPLAASTDGAGNVRFVNGTVPGAGVDVSETVPTGARWELLNIAAQLVPDASVSNRQPYCYLHRSGAVYAVSVQARTTPASQAMTFCWSTGLPLAIDPTLSLPLYVGAGLPAPCFLQAADGIVLSAYNMQIGDQWLAPRLTVREWLDV